MLHDPGGTHELRTMWLRYRTANAILQELHGLVARYRLGIHVGDDEAGCSALCLPRSAPHLYELCRCSRTHLCPAPGCRMGTAAGQQSFVGAATPFRAPGSSCARSSIRPAARRTAAGNRGSRRDPVATAPQSHSILGTRYARRDHRSCDGEHYSRPIRVGNAGMA